MPKKKILFLDQYAQLGGGQKVLLSIIKHLKDDYNCSVVVPGHGLLTDELNRLKVHYIVLPVGYYGIGHKTLFDIISYTVRIPYLAYRLKHILRMRHIDLVYANGARTFIWATLACKMTQTPVVWHVHSIFNRGIIRALCLIFGRDATVKKIIAVSKAAAAPLTPLSKKMEIMYNAVDITEYFPQSSSTTPASFRNSLGIKTGCLITMVGLLLEWKGIDDFIRAAHTVIPLHPEATFVIVGDVLYNRSGIRYKRHLFNLVRTLNIQHNVVFTGFRKDVANILRETDIFVLASRQPDPCPTSLLQAMASGASVIATNAGGPQEIIREGENGLLYTANKPEELAAKIICLLDNPDKKILLADNAVKSIRKNYREDLYLPRLKAIIDRTFIRS